MPAEPVIAGRADPGHGASRLGCGGRRGGGQGEDHGEAAAGCVVGDEGSVHGFGEPAGQGEAKTDPGVVVPVAEPLEGLENAVSLCGRDAGPAVGDPQVDLVVVAARGQQYVLAGGTVAHRVGGEVGQDPLEQGGVGEYLGQVIGQADADAAALRPEIIQDAPMVISVW